MKQPHERKEMMRMSTRKKHTQWRLCSEWIRNSVQTDFSSLMHFSWSCGGYVPNAHSGRGWRIRVPSGVGRRHWRGSVYSRHAPSSPTHDVICALRLQDRPPESCVEQAHSLRSWLLPVFRIQKCLPSHCFSLPSFLQFIRRFPFPQHSCKHPV